MDFTIPPSGFYYDCPDYAVYQALTGVDMRTAGWDTGRPNPLSVDLGCPAELVPRRAIARMVEKMQEILASQKDEVYGKSIATYYLKDVAAVQRTESRPVEFRRALEGLIEAIYYA